jgi:hypothetical protein
MKQFIRTWQGCMDFGGNLITDKLLYDGWGNSQQVLTKSFLWALSHCQKAPE